MGPIGVKKHLAPFLPSHPVVSTSFIVVDIFGHVFYYIHYKVHCFQRKKQLVFSLIFYIGWHCSFLFNR